ncbi:MAG: phosphodiester glycosidase family protein [Bacteroidia bacterium]|nr:phosphodiester glycosidase family protein [Bacteroidia bacterium]
MQCTSSCSTEIVRHNGAVFETFRVDSVGQIVFGWKSDTESLLKSFEHFEAHLKEEGRLIFATNGGMFTPELNPVGWYVEKGQELHPLNLDSGYGNFYLFPNGVFGIDQNGEAFVQKVDSSIGLSNPQYATQSGPMLVIDNELHPAFRKESTNTYIRSGVGVNQEGQVVFAISNEPVNFYTFAELFREKLKCPNALYLDGAISKMYNESTGRSEDGEFGVMIGVIEY